MNERKTQVTCLAALMFAACASDATPKSAEGALAPGQRSDTQVAPAKLPDSPLLEEPNLPPALRDMIARLDAMYSPEVARHGRTLELLAVSSNEAGAWAIPKETAWQVRASRALLAEKPGDDVIAMILCHEVGHLLGGFPFKGAVPGVPLAEGTKEAAEMQSDYFAGKECLPRLFASEPEVNARFRDEVDASTRARCDDVWRDEGARDVCYRIARTAERFGIRDARRNGHPTPDLETPATDEVERTLSDYANSQCRVDTVVQGALCTKRNRVGVIPGIVDATISPDAEALSEPYACSEGPGARPRCWYKATGERLQDCSAVRDGGECIEQDGEPAIRFCHARGIEVSPCAADEVCTTEFGGASCFTQELIDSLREELEEFDDEDAAGGSSLPSSWDRPLSE